MSCIDHIAIELLNKGFRRYRLIRGDTVIKQISRCRAIKGFSGIRYHLPLFIALALVLKCFKGIL